MVYHVELICSEPHCGTFANPSALGLFINSLQYTSVVEMGLTILLASITFAKLVTTIASITAMLSAIYSDQLLRGSPMPVALTHIE